MSKANDLKTWQQQAQAQAQTELALERVLPTAAAEGRAAAAEADLATLGATASAQEESQCVVPEEGSVGALGDFRLRLTPEPVLQAEKLPEELLPELRNILIRHGFWPCGLEAGDNISGFYDAGDSAGRH